MKNRLLPGAVISFMLVALSCSCPLSTVLPPSVTSTPTSAPPTLTPSQTQPPVASPMPSLTPSLRSGYIPLPQDARLNDIWVDGRGSLWISTSTGIFLRQDDGWEQLFDDKSGDFLGANSSGIAWVLLDDSQRIASFNGTDWKVYGAAEGWEAPGSEYLSPGIGDTLSTDANGYTWLATGVDDLRRFDPMAGKWERFSAEDIGFNPPYEEGYQGHFLTDTLISPDGTLWVSDCIGMGEGLSGQGIRSYDGTQWQFVPSTPGLCIFDMEMDQLGRAWVGTFDKIMLYDPTNPLWLDIALPAYERHQLVVKIDLDPTGNPWLEVLRSGGASLYGSTVHMHLEEKKWVIDDELPDEAPARLAFTPAGDAWMCNEHGLFRLMHGVTKQVLEQGSYPCRVQVDGSGHVWTAFPLIMENSLWQAIP